jgi:tetratricopeptide (TPR) repeat protein
MLEDARRLAPAYGLPVALSAWGCGQTSAHGFGASSEEARHSGIQFAEQAAALDPHDPLVLTLASGALTLAHRLEQADQLLNRALALDPWSPYAWVRRGWASAYAGDAESALRELKMALHLAPFGPLHHLALIGVGCAHFASGRYERAVQWVQTGTAAAPAAFWGDRMAVAAAARSGALTEARRLGRKLLRKDRQLTVAKAGKAWPFPREFMGRLCEGLQLAGIPKS